MGLWHLRLKTYIYEAKQIERKVRESYLEGPKVKYRMRDESELVGRVRFEMDHNIYCIRKCEEDALEWFMDIMSYIFRRHPLFTCDVTFSEYNYKRNIEIYKAVL